MAPTCDVGEVAVFDPSGAFLRTLGQLGQGPGDLQRVLFIAVGSDDFIYVFDSSRRLTIFTPDHRLHRTDSEQVIPNSFVAGPVEQPTIRQAAVNTPERAGLPIHVVSSEGEIMTSFGADGSATYDRSAGRMNQRRIEEAGETSVWVAHTLRYQIELWSLRGALLRTMVRSAPWFPPWAVEPRIVNPTALADIRQGADGLLWTLVTVEGEPMDEVLGGADVGPDEIRRLVDTVIEVINPETNEVVASERVELAFSAWVRDLTFETATDTSGNVVVRVWRPELGPEAQSSGAPQEQRRSQ